MDIVIDFSWIYNLLYLSPEVLVWKVFIWVGWIPIALTLLWGFKEMWLLWRAQLWGEKNAKFMLLAIDIPRENMQSPKAVENMFSYVAGAHSSVNLLEKYWDGKWQLYFSFEIVSIEGYTQFLVYTPIIFRDLVESAVYSQYPDAEITEVDDYTTGYPTRFPDETYDIWGGEFILAKHHMIPIKTYKDFEHQFGDKPENQFRDPLAALMDLNSSLGPGEQLWYQIIAIPEGFDWMEEGDKQVSKILGEKTASKKGAIEKLFDPLVNILDIIGDAIMQMFGVETGASEEAEDDPLTMMNLKPKTKKQVEGIEDKTSKIGFSCKIRMIYLAEKDVFRKPTVLNGFVGFMKQFGDLALNNIKPDMDVTGTTVSYFMKDYRLKERKNRIMSNYINRSDGGGRKPFILNIEELATLWHFPIESSVRAPMIQKAAGRRAEAPMNLPRGTGSVERQAEADEEEPDFLREEPGKVVPPEEESEGKEEEVKGGPPQNLPTV